MRILKALFVALVMLTAASAYSHSRHSNPISTVTAADPIPRCPTLNCPGQPPPQN